MGGQEILLDLFRKCEEQIGSTDLLRRVASQIVARLLVNKNGVFDELTEARRQYPKAYEKVLRLACEEARVPNGGLRALLGFCTADRQTLMSLRESLRERRRQALKQEPIAWPVLEVFADHGLTKELETVDAEELESMRKR